ncbi:MAG: RdgB/HAM1 family non-canonical purine NTP pyrophosphatase [Eubacteriales bacterium]|nr:RdgB/HAM1 family non-canonical purine NTP pyrophosphatase [Eubacteriales bacterium]
MEIVLATHNPDKVKEFQEILPEADLSFVSLHQLGLDREVEETGHTYQENADLKALAAYEQVKRPVLADDSGLSVDALDGYPGIYSARFAGEHTSYKDKIARLWQLLAPFPAEEWTGSFFCALSYISASGRLYHFERSVAGLLLPERRGSHGFGYDPIFYLPALGQTTAELLPQQKHAVSHRGLALRDWYRALQEGKLV